MKRNKWRTRIACGALVMATAIVGAFAVGSQGSQSDPLVTLSYLNEVAVPEIMKQVDKKVSERGEEWKKSGGAAFLTVELAEGKSLSLTAGTQFLLRTGTLTSTDALVDLTEGSAWNADGSLKENHLYIATGDKQKLTAASAVTLMIQGSYAIE